MIRTYIKYIILLFVSISLQSQTFNLKVINGEGSGNYNLGDTVHIWSNAVFGDSVFVDWSGEGASYLTSPREWHSTIVIPEESNIDNISLNANYDTFPALSQLGSASYLLFGKVDDTLSLVNKETFYAIPPNPKAIVFFLHGTGGKGKNFFENYERYNMVKDFLYEGFAVFTLDANEVTMGDQNGDGKLRWDISSAFTTNSTENIDIANVEQLKDSVIREFDLPHNIPCFSLGMSAGAVFSDLCASVLGFRASAHITANGVLGTYYRSDIAPVIWIMSENDNNENADDTKALNNYSTMKSKQTAEWHWLRRSPVHPLRFVRSSNNISPEQSKGFFQSLASNNLLDTNNLLNVLDLSSIPLSVFDNLGLTLLQMIDIRIQLMAVNADHILHSDYNKNILQFFDKMLAASSINIENQVDNTQFLFSKTRNNAYVLHSKRAIVSIEIYNFLGQKISAILPKANKHEIEIDLSTEENGIYFLLITATDNKSTLKLMKI